MEVKLELVENNRTIRRLASIALAKEINKHLNKRKSGLVIKVQRLIRDAFVNSFEYKSLNAGRGASPPGGLRAEFGLSNPSAKLSAIIDKWVNSVNLQFDPVRAVPDGFKGGILLTAINADFGDVISLEEATQISRGGNIPWLEWMLTRAGQAVVDGYDILIRPGIKTSRSGNAIMIPIVGSQYEVPNKPFAGTITDNWVTRTVTSLRPAIQDLFIRMMN